jgi:hypothetical protein
MEKLTVDQVNVEKHLHNLNLGLYHSLDEINLQLKEMLENNEYQNFLNFSIAYALYATLDSEENLINDEFLNLSVEAYLTNNDLLAINNKNVISILKVSNYSYDLEQVQRIFKNVFYDHFKFNFKIVATKNGDQYINDVFDTQENAITKAFSNWCSLTTSEKISQSIEVYQNDNLLIEFSLRRYFDNLEILLVDVFDAGKIELDSITFYSGKYLLDHNMISGNIENDPEDIYLTQVYYLSGLYYEYINFPDKDFTNTLDIYKRCFYN